MPWGEIEHKSDTRTVMVTLSTGNMRFRDFDIVDEAGTPRTTFGEGEDVRVDMAVINDGDVADECWIKVIETDTGEVLRDESLVSKIEPGDVFHANLVVGVMPNHDWYLTFEITP